MSSSILLGRLPPLPEATEATEVPCCDEVSSFEFLIFVLRATCAVALALGVFFSVVAIKFVVFELPTALDDLPGEVILSTRGGAPFGVFAERTHCVDSANATAAVALRGAGNGSVRCDAVRDAIADVAEAVADAVTILTSDDDDYATRALLRAVRGSGFDFALKRHGALGFLQRSLSDMLTPLMRRCFPPLVATEIAVAESFLPCGELCQVAAFTRITYLGWPITSRIALSPLWFSLDPPKRADILLHECLHKGSEAVTDLFCAFCAVCVCVCVCVCAVAPPRVVCTTQKILTVHTAFLSLFSTFHTHLLSIPKKDEFELGYSMLSARSLLQNADSIVALIDEIRTQANLIDEYGDEDEEYGAEEYDIGFG